MKLIWGAEKKRSSLTKIQKYFAIYNNIFHSIWLMLTNTQHSTPKQGKTGLLALDGIELWIERKKEITIGMRF